jgi:hypothetical protein
VLLDLPVLPELGGPISSAQWSLPAGKGFVTVVTLTSLRADRAVRPAAESSDPDAASETDGDNEDADEDDWEAECETEGCGHNGEAWSRRSTGASSPEASRSTECHGAGACVLSWHTDGFALPLVVIEFRCRERCVSTSSSAVASPEEHGERSFDELRPRLDGAEVLSKVGGNGRLLASPTNLSVPVGEAMTSS